jgi:hypothetical protein
MAGIGPATSPLPRECSTTEPHGPRYKLPFANIASPKPNVWSGRRGSNSRHSVWKTEALPTELHPLRTLTQSKPFLLLLLLLLIGGGGWIRTSVLRENGFTVRRL